ncbi:MAG: RNA polymerase sigma factor (sigma-70 family) [Glaciecola sp.]|jgi:RNA polymerase sigma factor (sigma-70 family)
MTNIKGIILAACKRQTKVIIYQTTTTNKLLNEALSSFMQGSKTSLLNYLSKLVTASEAEEIAQEAYLKLYLLVKEKPSHHNYIDLLHGLRPMLTLIAKNLALSAIRHKKVEEKYAESQLMLHSQVTTSENLGEYNTEAQVITENENLRLIVVINRLPPICRQVFIQRKLYAKSHQQIANILNISTKTVENHLTKGLILCRKYMFEQIDNKRDDDTNSSELMSKVVR